MLLRQHWVGTYTHYNWYTMGRLIVAIHTVLKFALTGISHTRNHTVNQLDSGWIYWFAPPNCTNVLQPQDMCVNKPLKDALKSEFTAWYSKQVCLAMKDDTDVTDIDRHAYFCNKTSSCKVDYVGYGRLENRLGNVEIPIYPPQNNSFWHVSFCRWFCLR